MLDLPPTGSAPVTKDDRPPAGGGPALDRRPIGAGTATILDRLAAALGRGARLALFLGAPTRYADFLGDGLTKSSSTSFAGEKSTGSRGWADRSSSSTCFAGDLARSISASFSCRSA